MSSNIAMIIKDKLTSRRMSVRDLEREANLKRSVVHNIISGKSKQPTADTLLAIAKTLECTVDELIQGQKIDTKHNKTTDFNDTLQNSTLNILLALDCVQVVSSIITAQKKEITAKLFWSMVQDTYYYSSLGSDNKYADKKYAEWLIWQKLK